VFVGWTDDGVAMLARAVSGGLLGESERIGRGRLLNLAAGERGGLVAAVARYGRDGTEDGVDLRYRPAGERFGRPVTVPVDEDFASTFAASPRGEALLGAIDMTDLSGPGAIDVTGTLRGGAAATTRLVSAPEVRCGTPLALAADGRGRVLAAWSEGSILHTAVRTRTGVWSASAEQPVGYIGGVLRAAATRDGHAVIVWETGGLLQYATGTLTSAEFGQPTTLGTSDGFNFILKALPGDTMVLAFNDAGGLRVATTTGGEPFGTPATVPVDPGNYLGVAGVTRDGRVILWAGDRLVRETRR
jgi:hypothetical protein